MKPFTPILLPLLIAGLSGCASKLAPPVAYVPAPAPDFYWPQLSETAVPAETNQTRIVLPPPFLQLPEQTAAREEVEKSGVPSALVQKMLHGHILNLAEVAQLAQKKVSDTNIVKYLRTTGAIYTLTTRQIDELRAASVSSEVVDYLLTTSALGRSVWYYPAYLYRPVYPLWDYHHDYDIHHYDFHHDSHRHHH